MAALLLGRLGSDAAAAVPALLTVLDEPLDLAVQPADPMGTRADPASAAARALGVISSSGEVIAALILLLKSDVAIRREAAAYGLARIGPTARLAAPALVAEYNKWLDSATQFGGYELTIALGRVAPHSAVKSDAIKALVRALDDRRDWIVRQAALALGRFGKAATAAAAPRLRKLKEQSAKADLRAAAASALEAIEGAVSESR